MRSMKLILFAFEKYVERRQKRNARFGNFLMVIFFSFCKQIDTPSRRAEKEFPPLTIEVRVTSNSLFLVSSWSRGLTWGEWVWREKKLEVTLLTISSRRVKLFRRRYIFYPVYILQTNILNFHFSPRPFWTLWYMFSLSKKCLYYTSRITAITFKPKLLYTWILKKIN